LGISLGDKLGMFSVDQVTKLWLHESERVFADRLLENDLDSFNAIVSEVLKTNFKQNHKTISNNNFLVFGNFCPVVLKIDGNDKKVVGKYVEIKEKNALKERCYSLLGEYNSQGKSKMNLVLFDTVILNLSRICRIMTLPAGHGVMVGNGGSGRKSLLALGTHIMGMRTFTVDLKKTHKEDFFSFW